MIQNVKDNFDSVKDGAVSIVTHIWVFSVLKLHLKFVEFAKFFCYQYLYIRVVISTSVLKFCTQESISKLTQVNKDSY